MELSNANRKDSLLLIFNLSGDQRFVKQNKFVGSIYNMHLLIMLIEGSKACPGVNILFLFEVDAVLSA